MSQEQEYLDGTPDLLGIPRGNEGVVEPHTDEAIGLFFENSVKRLVEGGMIPEAEAQFSLYGGEKPLLSRARSLLSTI